MLEIVYVKTYMMCVHVKLKSDFTPKEKVEQLLPVPPVLAHLLHSHL